MKSNNIFKIGLIISIIMLFFGIPLIVDNIGLIEYTTFFGQDKAKELSRTAISIGLPYTDYSYMSKYGNEAVMGIIIICGSILILVVAYVISNNKKLIENGNKQIELLENRSTLDSEHLKYTDDVGEVIKQKLKNLTELKDENLITEEEYNLKRQDILNNM